MQLRHVPATVSLFMRHLFPTCRRETQNTQWMWTHIRDKLFKRIQVCVRHCVCMRDARNGFASSLRFGVNKDRDVWTYHRLQLQNDPKANDVASEMKVLLAKKATTPREAAEKVRCGTCCYYSPQASCRWRTASFKSVCLAAHVCMPGWCFCPRCSRPFSERHQKACNESGRRNYANVQAQCIIQHGLASLFKLRASFSTTSHQAAPHGTAQHSTAQHSSGNDHNGQSTNPQ